jgi:hypothetical protein
MNMRTLSKTLSGIALVSLCAIAFTGCAQFEDSFGELRSPGIADASNPEGSAGSKDRSEKKVESENGDAASANGARSLMIGGVRVELTQGQIVD